MNKAITDIIQMTYGDDHRASERKVAEKRVHYGEMSARKIGRLISDMEQKMYQHAENLEFEEAARIRDEITQIRQQTLITETATS